MNETNFLLLSKKGKKVVPVCLKPEEFELWVIPFHYEKPFMLAKSHNVINLIGTINKREKDIVDNTVIESNHDWKEQYIIPANPISMKETYSDFAQKEVAELVNNNVIIAAYRIDADESDDYVIIQKNVIEICVVQVDHCRGYEGTSISMHMFNETLEQFIKKYNNGEYKECFSNGKIILAEHNDFGFHESEYNGYMYNSEDCEVHFILI